MFFLCCNFPQRDAAAFVLQSLRAKDAAWLRAHHVDLAPGRPTAFPHRGRVSRVRHEERGVTSLSEDGHLVIWTPSASMLPVKKHAVLELGTSMLSSAMRARPKWTTDFVTLPALHKLVVATGERELWFYDLSTLEVQFVLFQLDGTPMRLTSTYSPANLTTTLVYGDDQVLGLLFKGKRTNGGCCFASSRRLFSGLLS